MDYSLKRTSQLDGVGNMIDALKNLAKKQKIGDAPNLHTNDGDKNENGLEHQQLAASDQDGIARSPTKEKKQTTKMRLESNRQRAKEIRKRKKIMVEDMQKKIVILTMENNNLRTESQAQQEEIVLLRKASQLMLSNNAVSF